MIHKSSHHGVEFLSEIEDQPNLHAWYDHLPANEIKASITKIKCREYRPYDQASFRLIVLCRYPFSDRLHRDGGNSSEVESENYGHDISALIALFTDWIERHDMPDEVILGERSAFIDWVPTEMIDLAMNELSPQDQAQLEMSNHMLDCLELIRLATVSDPVFSELWMGTNEPFFAAGRLLYGDFQWIRDVPVDFCRGEANSLGLLERVRSCAREFVGILRLALLTDAESPILDQVSFVIRRFNLRYSSKIPKWQNLACELLDKADDSPLHATIADTALYQEIDTVCDRLRSDLVDVTQGLEDELVTMLDALLPTLEVPPSSVLFSH